MKTPAATYRLQFHSEFNFEAAKNIIDYLAELGISDIYASPIFKARKGSTHGYDVVDATQLNPELGEESDFTALIEEIQNKGMGWVQDIVPNHMAYDTENEFLMDVLENGEESEYFDFFDINWNQPYEEMQGRVLAPLLGDFYSACLENGEIKLEYDVTGLTVNYYQLKLPIRVESYVKFVTHNLGHLAKKLGRDHTDFIKLLGILYILKNIPGETKGKERENQINFVQCLLWELYEQNPDVKALLDDNIKLFNGEPGNSESFNILDEILNDQVYRLAFWKVGAEEINYRRFFTVNELISVKVEELKVFQKTHELIAKLVAEGKITGLRIDHIDGLYNPKQYLERLRENMGDAYLLVEKILELTEDLPENWAIQGTSGYEFLNYVNGVLCERRGADKLAKLYERFTGNATTYKQLVYEKKALILEKNLAGDLDNLALILKRVATQTREGSDYTLNGLKRALSELLTLFPVYRSYITSEGVTDVDKKYVQSTIETAKKQVPLLVNEFSFIQKILLLEYEDFRTETQREEWLHFVMRFQQLTGPLMAKGVEDTLFYVYNRLVSLNEVGGNPSEFGISLDSFHQYNLQKVQEWQYGMNATATHDTKRGEDVRSRLNILSEIPQEWENQVTKWQEINAIYKTNYKTNSIPDANDEYFFYQTLVGAYPFEEKDMADFPQRIKDYIIKAVREAKVHTAWLRPDNDYETGFLNFVEKVLNNPEFLSEFLSFQKRVASYGIYNSLAQVLLKNTAPGVPDLYQGAELWELSLVDPDNRRPVNYQQRRDFLGEIKHKITSNILILMEELLEQKENGKIKMFLTHRILQARQKYLSVFLEGDYEILTVTGRSTSNIIAFARNYEGKKIVAIAPRFLTNIIHPREYPLGKKVWGDTQIELPQGNWENLITSQKITGDKILIGEILQHFPVALLVN